MRRRFGISFFYAHGYTMGFAANEVCAPTGSRIDATLLPMVKVEIIVGKIPVADVIESAKKYFIQGIWIYYKR